jgi:hypothetical protein
MISGCGNVSPFPTFPTAQQLLEERQLTLSRVAPVAAGADTATQLDPSQRRIWSFTLLFVSSADPTAQQSTEEAQLTARSWLWAEGCGRLEAGATAGATATIASGAARLPT